MERHVISNSEKELIKALVNSKCSKLAELNNEFKDWSENHDKTKMLNETKFLPTGLLAYQLVKTEAYKNWLAVKQKNNPFIGKEYFQPAPEYSEDSEIEEQKELSADEATDIVETYVDENGVVRAKIRDDYDPNNAESVDDGEMSADERNIFDFTAIKSTVAAHLEWEVDDVFDSVVDALNELHIDDENYEVPDGLRAVVEQLHTAENIKLLSMQTKTVDSEKK